MITPVDSLPLFPQMSNAADRLSIELEFVQCLANPAYLNCNKRSAPSLYLTILYNNLVLVEQGYLKDPKFLAYLSYLHSYLTASPPHRSLLLYPNGLQILGLLQREEFRRQIGEATAGVVDYIHKQQYHHWINYNASGHEHKLDYQQK